MLCFRPKWTPKSHAFRGKAFRRFLGHRSAVLISRLVHCWDQWLKVLLGREVCQKRPLSGGDTALPGHLLVSSFLTTIIWAAFFCPHSSTSSFCLAASWPWAECSWAVKIQLFLLQLVSGILPQPTGKWPTWAVTTIWLSPQNDSKNHRLLHLTILETEV